MIVDRYGPRRHQQSRHRGRRRGQGLARRQARVRGDACAQGSAHRSCGTAHQGRARAISGAANLRIPMHCRSAM